MLTETKFSHIDLTIHVLLSILMLQFESFKDFDVIK
jgi:hypothetical protein